MSGLKACPICNKKPAFEFPEKLVDKMGFHRCDGYTSIIIDVVCLENKSLSEAWNEWVDTRTPDPAMQKVVDAASDLASEHWTGGDDPCECDLCLALEGIGIGTLNEIEEEK
jgi:hypothetical protein